MKMKKGAVILASLFSLILVSGLAAAQNFPAPPVTLADVSGLLSAFLIGGTGESVLVRLLLVVLLTSVLYKPAGKIVGERSSLAVLVALLVSILGIRFLTPADLVGILLPFNAVAVTVSAFLPLLLFAIFINTVDLGMPSLVRKVGYILMGVSFFVLWWQRYGELGDLAYIYAYAAIATGLLLLFDGTARRWSYELQAKGAGAMEAGVQVEIINERIEGLIDKLKYAKRTRDREILMKAIGNLEDTRKDLIKKAAEQ